MRQGAPFLPVFSQYGQELMRFRDALEPVPETGEGEQRYAWYRRKRYEPDEARRFALAFERNMVEQKARRRSHDTGA